MVLTWIDYAVIAAYLLAITAFGSWFARFQKTTRDYFLTGRSVPCVASVSAMPPNSPAQNV